MHLLLLRDHSKSLTLHRRAAAWLHAVRAHNCDACLWLAGAVAVPVLRVVGR
jgi:hypothetical protein